MLGRFQTGAITGAKLVQMTEFNGFTTSTLLEANEYGLIEKKI
jgi:hypothetical protein